MKKINFDEIPENPGVYLMKKDARIIYIGKAKNLKKRVSSYFVKEHSDEKTRELVKNIEDIEYIICNSELDALILENNLIKKHKPKYNINLKDHKTYPYIKISKEEFPKISIVRSTKALDSKNGEYFGPYPSGAYHLLRNIMKIFKIRDCNRDMDKEYRKPCLKYYMGICMGPCVYKDVEQEYSQNVQDAKKFLKGDTADLLRELKEKMEKYSQEMDFERAIVYREQINEIEKAVKNQVTEKASDINEDLFLFGVEADTLFICVLNVREGKIISKVSSNMKLEDSVTENIFEDVVTAFYSKNTIPKNIIFDSKYSSDEELIKGWLIKNARKNINVYFPSIKSRRMELLNMGHLNLKKDMDSYFIQKHILEQGLIKLHDILDLKKYPRRIECFDISNIQGKDAVASMSVAIEGRLSKKNYRKFRIRVKDTPDDFAMMEEALERRYSKLNEWELPDLILVDGGLGQLGVAEKVLKKLKKEKFLDIISIAKREEEIFKLGESVPYIFDSGDESLKILQRLRDEAHRFGVTYHRKLRSKRVIKSELDNIPGIGPKRKEALLKRFKSVKMVKSASLEELKECVPEDVAKKIKKLGEEDD